MCGSNCERGLWEMKTLTGKPKYQEIIVTQKSQRGERKLFLGILGTFRFFYKWVIVDNN